MAWTRAAAPPPWRSWVCARASARAVDDHRSWPWTGWTSPCTAGEVLGLLGPNGAGEDDDRTAAAGPAASRRGHGPGCWDATRGPTGVAVRRGLSYLPAELHVPERVTGQRRCSAGPPACARRPARTAGDAADRSSEAGAGTGRPGRGAPGAGPLPPREHAVDRQTAASSAWCLALGAPPPRLVVLDEPTSGLDPVESSRSSPSWCARGRAGRPHGAAVEPRAPGRSSRWRTGCAVVRAGRLVASGTVAELTAQAARRLTVRARAEMDLDDLRGAAGRGRRGGARGRPYGDGARHGAARTAARRALPAGGAGGPAGRDARGAGPAGGLPAPVRAGAVGGGTSVSTTTELTRQAVADDRRLAGGWALGVAVLVGLTVATYPAVRDAPGLEELALPDGVAQAFGLQDLTSPAGYLRSQLFGAFLPALLTGLGVAAGARLAREEEAGRLDLVLAGPVRRRSVVVARAGACPPRGGGGRGRTATALVLGGRPGGPGPPRSWTAVSAGLAVTLLGVWHAALALAGGRRHRTTCPRPGRGGRGRGGPGFVVDSLFPLVEDLEPLQQLSPWDWALWGRPPHARPRPGRDGPARGDGCGPPGRRAGRGAAARPAHGRLRARTGKPPTPPRGRLRCGARPARPGPSRPDPAHPPAAPTSSPGRSPAAASSSRTTR